MTRILKDDRVETTTQAGTERGTVTRTVNQQVHIRFDDGTYCWVPRHQVRRISFAA